MRVYTSNIEIVVYIKEHNGATAVLCYAWKKSLLFKDKTKLYHAVQFHERLHLTRRSGDAVWRTGKKNFNAVSHNPARP